MAFSGINSQQEVNQRILEDLQIKKQMLQKGGASSTVIPQYMQMGIGESTTAPLSTSVQTFGYFITTDSAFGNTILPVLPRFDGGK